MENSNKIALALPTNRGLKPKTLQSLLELVAYKDYNYEINPTTRSGYWIAIKHLCRYLMSRTLSHRLLLPIIRQLNNLVQNTLSYADKDQ